MADIQSNIQVNIDTSGALASLKTLQSQISLFQREMASSSAANALTAQKLQRSLLDDINATGKFSAGIRTIRSTTENFTNALEKNKLSMGEYFRFGLGATKTFGKQFASEFETIEKVARERVKSIQTQYISLGRNANGALEAISVRPLTLDLDSLETKTAMASQRQQIFNQLMKQGSTNLLNFGKNTQWAGRQLMVGFTIPLSIFGTTAAKEFMALEEQTIRFKRVYGDLFSAPDEADKMIGKLKALGQEFTKYGVALKDTMALAADAAAMGQTGQGLVDQVTQANKLAVLGQVEQSQALETTISLTSAFGYSTGELAKKINFLNAVENQTVTSIGDLTEAIPKAGPVIKQLGGDVEDLSFFLTAMKEGGINASEGANALKSGLASIINPTEKAASMLKVYGINIREIVDSNRGDIKSTVIDFATALDKLDPTQRAQAIEQLFGKFQFARLSTLFQNVIAEGNQANRVLELSNATTSQLASLSRKELKTVEESTTYKFTAAIEKFQAAMAPVGEQFMKMVTPLIDFGTKILDMFNNMSDGAKSFVTGIIGIVGGIAPVFIMTFGLIANAIANGMKGFLFLKNLIQGTAQDTNILGEQTQYMTQEQLDAAAVAASLDQVHARLIQTFTSEAGAIDQLRVAMERAAAAQARFGGVGRAAAGAKPMKYADGVLMVPGSGNGDTVPAMLTPGEAVIPKNMVKKYAPLIQGMITGNLQGFNEGKFPSNIGAKAGSAKSSLAVENYLQAEIMKIRSRAEKYGYDADEIVARFISHVTAATKDTDSVTKASIQAIVKGNTDLRAIYSKNASQQTSTQFAHIGSGAKVTAQQLKDSNSIIDPKTLARLEELVRVLPNKNVSVKSGWGFDAKGDINNKLGKAGASMEEFMSDFEEKGPKKWGMALDIGGSSFDNLEQEITAFDTAMMDGFRDAAKRGVSTIVDTEAQIDAMEAKALANGKEFNRGLYASVEAVEKQALEAIAPLGTELRAVIDTAKRTITEIRASLNQTDIATMKAAGPSFVDRLGTKRGLPNGDARLTPGGTAANRKAGGVGVANIAVDDFGTALLDAAEVNSPSRKTMQAAEGMVEGVEQTLIEGAAPVREAARTMVGGAGAGKSQAQMAAESQTALYGSITPTSEDKSLRRQMQKREQAAARQTAVAERSRQDLYGGAMPSSQDKAARKQSEKLQKTAEYQARTEAKATAAAERATAKQAAALDKATSSAKSFSNRMMVVSGAMSALSIGLSMFGVNTGALGDVLLNVTNIAFALSGVLSMLMTQERIALALKVKSNAQGAISGVMDAGGFMAGGKGKIGNLFGNLGKVIGSVTGSFGFLGKLFLRAIPWVGAALLVFEGFKLLAGWIQQQKDKVEGLGKAAFMASEKLNAIGEVFGFDAKKADFASSFTAAPETSENISNKEKATSAEYTVNGETKNFNDTFSAEITAVKNATAAQAEATLRSMAVSMAASGAPQEAVDGVIRGIQEAAGRTDLKLDFTKLDFSLGSDQGKQQFDKLIGDAQAGVGKAVAGKQEVRMTRGGPTERFNADAKKEIELMSGQYSTMFDALKLGFEDGSIDADYFNSKLSEITTNLDNMDPEVIAEMLPTIAKNLGIEDKLKGIKDIKSQILLVKAATAGVQINDSDLKALKKGGSAALAVQKRLNTQIENTVALKKEQAKQELINEAIATAGVQLTEQTAQLQTQREAYDILIQQGYDAATAFTLSGDAALAAGIKAAAGAGIGSTAWAGLKGQIDGFLAAQKAAPKNPSGGGEKSDYQKAIDQLKEQRKETLQAGIAYTRMKKAGLSAVKAFEYAQDPMIAAGMATAKTSKQVAALVKKIKELETAMNNAAFGNFLKGMNGQIAQAQKVSELTGKLGKMGATLDEISQLTEDEEFMRAFKAGKVDADKLAAALAKIKELAKIEIEIKMQTAEGMQEIYDDAFDKAMEAFSAKEQEIEINFIAKVKNDKAVVAKAEEDIAKIQYKIDDYEAGLQEIEWKEEDINKAYDKRSEALDKIQKANEAILKTQKSQLTIADALSQGDIGAAAKAIQDQRAAESADALAGQKDALDVGRQAALGNLTADSGIAKGMTRDQLELKIKDLKKEIFAIEEKTLEPAAERIRLAEVEKQKLIDNITVLGLTKAEWEKNKNQIDLARVNSKGYEDAIKAGKDMVQKLVDKWKEVPTSKTTTYTIIENRVTNSTGGSSTGGSSTGSGSSTGASSTGSTSTATKAGAIPATYTTKRYVGSSLETVQVTPAHYLGSQFVKEKVVVSKTKANGGRINWRAMGSDTVPAMLTPGEFVMRKSAVGKYGAGMMNAINSGSFKMPSMSSPSIPSAGSNVRAAVMPQTGQSAAAQISSVYNYSLSVNVASASNPNEIASVVMAKLKSIDSQRARGVRV